MHVHVAQHLRRGSACRWKAEGVLFLSNLRMVFVADRPDPATGLESFDLPLVYILRDKFNQPIFGCNNLSGECWPAVEGGGPSGSLPPHKWSLYFKTGGVGTFLPFFYTFVTGARQQERARQAGGGTSSSPAKPVDPTGTIGQAFVDPNDPTTVFLSQPITEDHRLPEAPKYAANYGVDESYAPLV